MTIDTAHSLYDEVIDVTEKYLGPAADRFVERQTKFHLKKKAQSLSESDLPQLVEWMKVSLALITEDHKMVDDCEKELLALVHHP